MGMEAVSEAIRERVGSAKAFLTFDIDFLDPAYAPGTGTPVPAASPPPRPWSWCAV